MAHYYRDFPDRELRQSIENNYNLDLLASNSELTVQRLSEIIEGNNEWQQDLIEANQEALDGIVEQLSEMTPLIGSIEEHTRQSSQVLHQALPAIIQQLQRKAKILVDIQETLAGLHDQEVRTIRKKAFVLLTCALPREPQFRDGDFQQAYDLLRKVADSPTQFDDYTVWFQIGWLEWKWKGNVSAAEQAFMTARRHITDSDTRNPYYWRSLWHAAYMQYLQGPKRFGDCYETICAAAEHTGYGPVHFDKARYAAVAGKTAHALSILKQRILRWPSTFFDCRKCSDFDGMREQVDSLLQQQLDLAHSELSTHLKVAEQSLTKAEQTTSALQLSAAPFEGLKAEYESISQIASGSHYVKMVMALPHLVQLPKKIRQELEKSTDHYYGREESNLAVLKMDIRRVERETMCWEPPISPPIPFAKALPWPVLLTVFLGLVYFGMLCNSESQRAGNAAYQQAFSSMHFTPESKERGPRLFGLLVFSRPAPSYEDQHKAFLQERQKQALGARRLVVAKTWGQFVLVFAGCVILLFAFAAANSARLRYPLLKVEDRKRQDAEQLFQKEKIQRLQALQDEVSKRNLRLVQGKPIATAYLEALGDVIKSTPPLSPHWHYANRILASLQVLPSQSRRGHDAELRSQKHSSQEYKEGSLSDLFSNALRTAKSQHKDSQIDNHRTTPAPLSPNARALSDIDTNDTDDEEDNFYL